MTFDDAIAAFASADSFPAHEMQWMLDEWEWTGPRCRALLHAYIGGHDHSERTEQALFVIVHLLAEQADAASFPDLCALMQDTERSDLVLGDQITTSGAALLISTFDGDTAPLLRLAEDAGADPGIRGDALLVLGYLARTGKLPEAAAYDILAHLPKRLLPREEQFVWFGWARTVAALGFAGLAGEAEAVFSQGLVDPQLMTLADFWTDLREAREQPGAMPEHLWDGLGPIGSAIDWLDVPEAQDAAPELPEPVRNPLRGVGRNDPCPCGSGKKFKKCCLPA